MKILIHDILQYSDAPSDLLSPALSDICYFTTIEIQLDKSRYIDSLGIGNTDATEVTINNQTFPLQSLGVSPGNYKNGLYKITGQTTDTLTISHNGTYMGRLAAGAARSLGCSPSREPGFWTTANPRTTLSGQIVPGAGGISGRQIQVKFTYKITEEIFRDFERAYPLFISRGYPYFVLFDEEIHRMPWERLYANMENEKGSPFILQSSVNYFRYSKSCNFVERF